MHANKPLVKEALEKLFEVKVDSVRIMIRKPKVRLVNKRPVKGKYSKKAIVTLKKGYSLDMFKQVEVSSKIREYVDNTKLVAKVEQE